MRKTFSLRVHLIFFFFCAFALLLFARLYFVQVVHGDEYSKRAEQQYARPGQTPYDRGTIYFADRTRAGSIQNGFTVALDPRVVRHSDTAYYALSDFLDVPFEQFSAMIAKKDDPYEEVARKVPYQTGLAIAERGVTGINLYKENWRFYPGGPLASHTLGFVAYDDNELVGRYGLERQYENTLKRDTGSISVNFFAEIFTKIGETVFRSPNARAGDIVTTIEPSVQFALEEELLRVEKEWGSKTIGGIVMDPKTGAIVAMASRPTFDLNAFGEVEDTSVFRNPLVENMYEMGSIIKPLTLAAGIDAGAITRETMYTDNGSITLDGYTISNYDGKARGRVNMQKALNDSLNTGMAFVVEQMGRKRFSDYMQAFGLGEKTGIDLPNESLGMVSNLKSPRAVEYATASFGQGIALSPIQTARALSALANGGYAVTPYVVSRIEYKNGFSKNTRPEKGEQAISSESSLEISRMLVEVVDDALRGGAVKREHYSIAAKTGTAQIARSDARGYYDDRYLHSFFGYFPAYEPRFLVFLFHTEPKGARYSSETLTEPFMRLTDFLINEFEIPPDR